MIGNFMLSEEQVSNIEEYVSIDDGQYKSYVFPNTEKTKACAHLAREMHKLRLESVGYKGYDDEVDNNYHVDGIYFIVTLENQIVMTSRVNARCKVNGFPFEMGEVVDGKKYVYDGLVPAWDINTYSLLPGHRKKAMPILLASIGNFLSNKGVVKAYCLVDIENLAVQKIYKDSKFNYSKLFELPVYFPTFTYEKTKLPVKWKVMEWDEDAITAYAKSHQQYCNLV